jgi:hypothetical protein
MAGGEQLYDRPALSEGAGRKDEGVVGEFHRIKLWAPAEEIQPPEAAVAFEAALAELKRLVAAYRGKVVEARAEAA